MQKLTDRELQVFKAMARSPHGSRLTTIAYRMGYRPAQAGQLPVRSTLIACMKRHGDIDEPNRYGECGRYVGRIPPQHQWDAETWFLTDAARTLIDQQKMKDG